MSYAYLHCRPNGVPFYVGKGKLRRVNNLRERNLHHASIVNKYGSQNILVGKFECSTDAIAYELEMGLIKCLRAMGVRLANYTAGGDGGRSPCPETRQRLSDAAVRRGVSENTRKAVSRAKKGVSVPSHVREKLSLAALGKVFTAEHRKNISISAKQRGISSKVRAAQRRAACKPVLVDGVLYPSHLAAATVLQCTINKLRWALKTSKLVDGHVVERAQ